MQHRLVSYVYGYVLKTHMKSLTTIPKILLLYFIIFSCENDEQKYTHTIHFDGNVPGAMYMTYTDYFSHGMSAGPNGDAVLIHTSSEPESLYDSITGWKMGYKTWKVTNQVIGEYKTYTVVLEEIE